jgi:cytoskeletal protein CcmA (bactofilin family)
MGKYGIIIMSGFAVLWFCWGLSGINPFPIPLALLPFLASGVLIALAMRMPINASEQHKKAVGRIVGWASAVEGVAMFAAANIMAWIGYPSYFICAGAAIVGLHFLPLAHGLGVRLYYGTAAALTALGALGCLIGDVHLRTLTVGVGAALVLWVTSGFAFRRKVEGVGGAVAA